MSSPASQQSLEQPRLPRGLTGQAAIDFVALPSEVRKAILAAYAEHRDTRGRLPGEVSMLPPTPGSRRHRFGQ